MIIKFKMNNNLCSILVKNINHRWKHFSKNIANIEGKLGEWRSVIGLEIHAQLSTKSKLFSSAPSCYGAPTNTTVSLFDAAIPGTLPVLNKTAVEKAVISALALGCSINPLSFFDRKHYFYSDLPAGYQITQQRKPIAENGKVEFSVYQPGIHKKPYNKISKIKQIQLEQDSGKSLHDEQGKKSYIDLNRAGIALIEIVFYPDIDDEEEAGALVKEVIEILERANTCSGKLEEGALRVDVNFSLYKKGDTLGNKTEIKNIGSVHGVVGAIKYERKRQLDIIKSGGEIRNETLQWDPEQKKTIVMRVKDTTEDYRFMPEPNLLPLRLLIDEYSLNYHKSVGVSSILDLRNLKKKVPSLPQHERLFLIEKFGLSEIYAFNLVNQKKLFKYFKEIMEENNMRNPKLTYWVLMYQLLNALKIKDIELNDCSVFSWQLGKIIDLIESKKITKNTGEYLIFELLKGKTDLNPVELVEKLNLGMISSRKELKIICLKVIENEKDILVLPKKKGRVAFNELVKKVIEETNGRADTSILVEVLAESLGEVKNLFNSAK